ncbi:ABC transporter substrate-binding protein [Alkalihalobacterium alkalinitrilicum]|uniref:ABC transporter substrate-binding protein n=1 Tax=Alkalihalobacterium alkalinitrilicum TaxID=427920 RepID=UPI0009950F8C|nr:ABC transporter substrate-binding protein [Alkalihalobacterium alkalinitrilicum]
MKNYLSKWGSLLIVLLVGLLFVACSNEPTSNSNEDPEANQEDSSTEQNVIRVTMDSDIDNLDPYAFKSDAAQIVVDATYETFVDFGSSEDSEGTIIANTDEVVPNLTDYEISEDGTVVTLKVNSGATFTNGDPVDAEAVAFSIERALTGGGYSALLWGIITVSSMDQVEVVDDSVVITLEQGSPMTEKVLPLALNVPVSPSVTQENATDADPWANDWYRNNILGTGPYLLSDWTPGVEYRLSPAPNYWNEDKLKNDGVIVRVVQDAQQRLALLKQGAVDVALGLPPRNLAELKEDPEITVYDFPSTNTNYLVMNNDVAPFDDPLVRQAVNLAIDSDNLINNVLYGFARPLNSVVPEGMPTHLDVVGDNAYNIEKAKELLEEAGVSGFSTELYVNTSRTEDQQVAVWIKDALEQIGINVEINTVSDAAYRENQQSGVMPMFIEYWFSWVNDPFFQMFWMFTSDAATNAAKYKNPEVDELIAQGMYELDETKREELSHKLQQMIVEDAPIALLYQRNYVVAANSEIKGMNRWPDQHIRFHTLHK